MTAYLLALDQGTTSSRALVFTVAGKLVAQSSVDLEASFPESGWVSQSAEDIWQSSIQAIKQAIRNAKISTRDITAMGITNQRETSIAWHAKTHQALSEAIVWQDRRTTEVCNKIKQDKKLEDKIKQKTGLVVDPYFSATKFQWMLQNIPAVKEACQSKDLKFGTVDSYLLWRLTAGKVHATDVSNACRTMLFDIEQQNWDLELLQLFDIPEFTLPVVKDSAYLFGHLDESILGNSIPITAILGDQQAATFGQACLSKGDLKCTFGTGSFMMLNTGTKPVYSSQKLLTTILYRLNGETYYGLEGAIFNAGSIIKWLQDKMRIISTAAETEHMAREAKPSNDLFVIPAFTGLAAPYWRPDVRGMICGITRDTDDKQLVRSSLDAICFQIYELLEIMQQESKLTIQSIRVDGGMTQNKWLMQRVADILNIQVFKPQVLECTAKGVALMAAVGKGLTDLENINATWQSDKEFQPDMSTVIREPLLNGWKQSIKRLLA